jgi:hypothetical protein
MAAGPTVRANVQAEIVELARTDREAKSLMRKGSQHLDATLRGSADSLLAMAARMRHEREPGVSYLAALADMQGHIRDTRDLLDTLTQRSGARRGG